MANNKYYSSGRMPSNGQVVGTQLGSIDLRAENGELAADNYALFDLRASIDIPFAVGVRVVALDADQALVGGVDVKIADTSKVAIADLSAADHAEAFTAASDTGTVSLDVTTALENVSHVTVFAVVAKTDDPSVYAGDPV